MFRTQEKLKCMKCNIIPQEFIVLNCYHLFCYDCLLQRNSLNMEITIVCSCGCQTVLKDNNRNIVKSPIRREVSQFSLSNQSSRNLKFEDKKATRNRQSLDEETIDQTYNTVKGYSKSKKESTNKLIKEIGCFTRSPLSKMNIRDNLQSNQNVDYQSHVDNGLKKQLKYIDIQFNKSICDLKDVFESKIQQFTQIINECKRNLRLWYSQLISDANSKINLSQYSKTRYQPISKQLDKLQNQIYSFKINISNKQIPLRSQIPSQHRRLKTQTYQIQTQIIVHPKKVFHYRSPSFQRHRSPEYICPHASLALQKHKFIRKQYNNLDQFM